MSIEKAMESMAENSSNLTPVGLETFLPKYEHPTETKVPLKYADIVTVDISEYDQVGGKERLAEQLRESVHQIGFFYIKNIGLSQIEIDQQFAIAQALFKIPTEELLQHEAQLEKGNYNGYRPLGAVSLFPGMKDTLEFYSIFKMIPQCNRSHPELVKQYWAEIEKFSRHMHENVSFKLLRILATMVGLPDHQFVDGHRYEDECDSSIRYMLYHSRSKEENKSLEDIYFRGHTDKGTLTFLFHQPIAALQVTQAKDTDWEYLKIPAGTVAVNIGDTLQFLTNGYMKSGFHRVIAPPADQMHLDRLGLLYFIRPTDKLPWKRLDSPFLQMVDHGKTTAEHDGDLSGLDWWRLGVRSRKGANYKNPRTD